jgi:sugar-phosphatase
MPQISCKAILFDMDGVPAVARVWSQWAREHGFDPEETVHRAHGRPSMTTIRELLPDADHEAENREVERREILDVEGVIPLPGVVEFSLRSLATVGPSLRHAQDRWPRFASARRASPRQVASSPPRTSKWANRIPNRI